MPHPKAYRALATELEDSELATTVASVRPPKAMLFTDVAKNDPYHCTVSIVHTVAHSQDGCFITTCKHSSPSCSLSVMFFQTHPKLPGSFANFRLDLEYIAWFTLQLHSCVCASRIMDTLRAEM